MLCVVVAPCYWDVLRIIVVRATGIWGVLCVVVAPCYWDLLRIIVVPCYWDMGYQWYVSL